MTIRQYFFIFSTTVPVGLLILAHYWFPVLHVLWYIILPLIALGLYDVIQRKHTILRIYPILGHGRFLLESVRPEIQQYFVESNTDGKPISREFRELVYQRAKEANDTRPFGTQFDITRDGYEWISHSLNPKPVTDKHPRVCFGDINCSQPYYASPFNISGMSYGALSKHAILSLNKAAKFGSFAHNTGEGGLSPYHLKNGGDLIWQIGTGYFSCRDEDSKFSDALFKEKATQDSVKMIEIKLSQGAKPGHGGVLPAAKLTQEIADIRHVPMGQDVLSPPVHSTFLNPTGLLEFVIRLRELSGGKPVGFKLCIGIKTEFMSICKAMLETGITPDFITVDGGEGGTGAAPVEFTNSVGMPLFDGLSFANNTLRGVGLRDKIRIMTSGKIFSAFHFIRTLALGANTVNSARGMMLALGCVQSRSCHRDTCPTGIATQNPQRYKSLDIADKSQRVANYHRLMIENLVELIATMGLERLEDVRPYHVNRRVNGHIVKTYTDIYPWVENGCLLTQTSVPDNLKSDWNKANANAWPSALQQA